MAAKEHPDVFKGRQQLIAVDVIDSDEAPADSSFVHDGAALYEEDVSGLLGAGVTEEVGDMQNYFKSLLVPTYCRVPRVGNTDETQTAAAGQTGRT